MDLVLRYNPAVLKAREVRRGELTENSLFDFNIQGDRIRIGIASRDGFQGEGSLAEIRFDVVGAAGSISPLRIESVSANRAIDSATLVIPTEGGVLTVISPAQATRGDASGDRRVRALDALIALQMAVGKRAEDLTLDMDDNGKITSLDARQILKMAVE
ncbi:MAG: hypothetical protein QHG99_02985 [Methanomicrobiales archaeon]|nr:hypothetical protein [Methanomicrobiales archaeon]